MAKKTSRQQPALWQQADARTLGQILAAQNIVFALPATLRIAEFYAQTLASVPGITASRVCLEDKTAQAGDMDNRLCLECPVFRGRLDQDEARVPAGASFQCSLAAQPQPDQRTIAVASPHHHFGVFVLRIQAAAAFEVYQPFLSNLANHVALTLENRQQKELLEKARTELERKVEERTRSLTAANQALAASRTTALAAMQEAVEVRQRTEQAHADLQREVAERQQAEIALRGSEERYRSLIEKIRAAVTVHGSDTRLVTCNPLAQSLLGLSEDHLLGRTSTDLIWRLYREDGTVMPAAEFPVNRVFATRQPVRDMVAGIQRPAHDDPVWVLVNADPVFGAENEIAQVIVTFIDITARKQAEERAQQTNELLRAIIEAAPTAIMGLDLDGHVHTVWNSAAEKMLGWSAAEVMGRPLPTVPAERQDEFRRFRDQIRAGMTLDGVEVRRQKRDGTPIDYSIYASPLHDAEGRISGNVAVLVDITERKRAEAALHQLNRELRAISNCNQTLLRAVDEQTLLVDVCRIVCDEAGYRMAWVGYAEPDEARSVRPVAWAGVDDGYLAAARITWADTERGRGPTGVAIRTGASDCIQDFASDPRAGPWRAAGLQRGYRSTIALPLKDESARTFGVLCLYAAEPNTFTADETRLLEELAGDLAFGVTVLRARAEHKKAEIRLLASEQLFRALVENAPDFIARYDRQCRRIYVNPAIQKLFGRPTEEVLSQTPADQSPVYAPGIYTEQLRQVIETASERAVEMPFRTAQGEMHWGHMRFVPEFGPDGTVASVLAIGRDIHEIKENEQRFRTLAENFPDFVTRFDRAGRYTYVNPAVEKAFGLPAEAILGKTLRELPQHRQPEQLAALPALIRRTFEAGVANETEMRWDTEMGGRIFEIRHMPEKDAAGNVVSVLAIARDITERRRAEVERLEHLRFLESLDHVNRIIQAAGDLEQMMRDVLDAVLGIFACDRAFLMYPCDPAAAVWGSPQERTRPEYPGVHELGIELPMDPGVAETLRRLLAAEGPVTFGPGGQYPLPADVSERFGIQCFMSMALYPKMGQPWQFGIHQCSYARLWTAAEERLFQEIGRRIGDALTTLLAHRHLQDSERRYREIFENTSDVLAVYEVTPDGRFRMLEFNPAWEKIVGIGRVGLMGRCLDEYPEDDTARATLEHFQECLARRAPLSYEQVLETPTGHWVLYTSLVPVSNAAGEIYRLIGVSRDITEQKRAQAAVRESEERYRTLFNVIDQGVAINEAIRDENGEVVDYRVVDINPAFLRHSVFRAAEVIGRRATDLYQMDPAYIRAWWQQHAQIEQPVHTEYFHPPSRRWFHIVTTPPAGNQFATFTTDITEPKRAEEEIRSLNAELNRRVAARTRELAALYEVSAMSSEAEPASEAAQMARALALALRVVESHSGAVHLYDRAASELRPAAEQGRKFLTTPAFAARVLGQGEPLINPDLHSVTDAGPAGAAPAGVTYVGLPMRVHGQVLGVLSVYGDPARQFSADDVALLAATADQMAVALENIRLRQRVEQMAVAEERARLARELHDSVTQSLYSLTLFAEAGREWVRVGDWPRAQAQLAEISETAQQTLKEMRLMVYELRPPILEVGGLGAALRQRLEAVERRAGIQTRLEVEFVDALPAPLEETLYAIAQEALNNALKHARATTVQVQLRLVGEQVELSVVDDGLGLDPQVSATSAGLGLVNMRQRAEKLGGTLSLASAAGAGTHVQVKLPWPHPTP